MLFIYKLDRLSAYRNNMERTVGRVTISHSHGVCGEK